MSGVGVVVPLRGEAKSLGPPRRGAVFSDEPIAIDERALLCLSGIGRERAARAARALLARGATALVSWGVAGGLDPDLRPGDLYLPDAILARDGRRLAVDAEWRRRVEERLAARITVHGGVLAESTRPLARPEDKKELHDASHAGAVDMESAAVAEVAAEAGVPFLAFRSICDSSDTALPACALACVTDEGRLRITPFLTTLARSPWDVRALLVTRRAFRAAQATLERTAELLGRELLAPTASTGRE